ncbi:MULTISPECIES: GNAT family N-acetyltransferase [Micromonospora]|uniref:N-acetyltransferase domain-containing protein n=1 Tax=Micromonospora gifhornensis TaxID=84594 RepID=A0ABQ4IDE8_9ACTN|nr:MULTISPECIES: GNAT family N-acetyltransferase [Micromonospora]PMR62436.1 GNAT family N-acetyltransferase [Verrucosispora sp. ts21]GIJ15946.1 hypothetical protein Vgi01_26300 [Micromonospora gifhornensis]
MTGHLIRDRTPADLPACVRLLAEVHRADRYPLNWPADPYRWLCPTWLRRAWVAVSESGDVVGHLAVEQTPDDGTEVVRLFVAPVYRRRRVGTDLLQRAAQWAEDQQITLTLQVVDRADSSAVALYEEQGWRNSGTSTADWTTADGRPVTVRHYVLSPGRLGR